MCAPPQEPKRAHKRNLMWPLTSANAVEAQVEIEGTSPKEREIPFISDNTEIVIIEGRWPLPPRG